MEGVEREVLFLQGCCLELIGKLTDLRYNEKKNWICRVYSVFFSFADALFCKRLCP